MKIFAFIIIGAFFLFVIIAGAVKMAVKEALYEIKEDIIKEFNLRKENDIGSNDED